MAKGASQDKRASDKKWGGGWAKAYSWPTHLKKWVGNCPSGPPYSHAYGTGDAQLGTFSGQEALSVSKRLWAGSPLSHLAPLDRRPSQSGGLYGQEAI